jgi:predicted transcriptional regulator
MKTAVSIPDDVFAAADTLAGRLGLSRSRLYARALSEYMAKHTGSDITARLNEVYARVEGGLDERLSSAQARSVETPGW